MSVRYPNLEQAPPVFTEPYPNPQQAPPVFTQPCVNPQQAPTVVVTQPYAANNQPIVVYQQQNRDVQHGCHCLLWMLTGGLWTPCWIAACCGCGKWLSVFCLSESKS